MLFITRFSNESVMIGEEIEIKISHIDNKSVCLGIQAPREISINRKESLNQIKAIVKKSKSKINLGNI